MMKFGFDDGEKDEAEDENASIADDALAEIGENTEDEEEIDAFDDGDYDEDDVDGKDVDFDKHDDFEKI